MSKKDVKNDEIFIYENVRYRYDGIFQLIKDLEYETTDKHCNYRVISGYDIKKDKPAIIIAFQESVDDYDWKENFTFWPEKVKAYKGWENRLWFHKGFYDEYQSARDLIVQKVSALFNPLIQEGIEPTIFVIGWSLGGSIAPICAEDMCYQFHVKPVIIAYEGANPCSTIHTRNFIYDCIDMDNSISFFNASDIVPLCPPFPFGYRLKKIIRHLGRHFCIIDCIKNTAYYHEHVDEAIRAEM